MTDEEKMEQMAKQLRQPEGEEGLKIAEMMNKANAQIIHDTLNVLDAGEYDKVLEIGMGDALFVKDIVEKYDHITYTGCDYSQLMIEQANKANAGLVAKGKANFINANISSLPFPDEQFDKTFTINTIYFWGNEGDAIKEVNRVLKTGGIFIVAFRPKHQMEKYPFTKFGFAQYEKSDVTKLLSQNGFQVIDVFENHEGDFDINGEMISRGNVVVKAGKI